MLHSRFLRAFLIVVAGLALLISASPRVEAANAVLEKTPVQSLVCLKLNNLNGALMQTDQFLAGVSPIGVSMFARMGLGQVLGGPMMSGVDMNGDFALFVAAMTPNTANAGPMPPISVAGLIPVTDYGTFISGNANCGPADGEGISVLTAKGLGIPPLFVGSVGQFALVGPAQDRQNFIQLQQQISGQADSLFSSMGGDLRKASSEQTLWLYCNMPLINKTFGPLIQMQLQMAKAMASGMQGQMPDVGMDPGVMIDSYGQLLSRFLQQSQYLTVSLHPTGEALRLNKSFAALPGSDLATLLEQSEPPATNTYLRHLPDGALINVAMNFNRALLERLTDWSWSMMSQVSPTVYTASRIADMKKRSSDLMDTLGRSGVTTVALAPNAFPPVRAVWLYEVTEPARFMGQLRGLWPEFEKFVDPRGAMKEAGLDMTFEYTKDLLTYKGVTIDGSKVHLKSTGDAHSEEAQVLERMYGDGWDYRWAVVGNTGLSVLGAEPDPLTREIIDAVKTGDEGKIQSELESALALLPGSEQADVFMTLNAVRLFALVAAHMPDQIPQVSLTPSKSNLVFAGQVGDGKASWDMVLPKTHLVEVRDLMQSIMMQRMAGNSQP